MADATQRMNYFDRQFLRAADFQLEQAYDLDRRRRHNRLLHVPGVAGGVDSLQVSGNVGNPFVTVSPGTAYDALGREIVLAESEQVDVSAVTGALAYITITYSEQASDPSTDPGVTGDTRISEQPGLAASAAPPLNPLLMLLLANVALASGKVSGSPDNTVRTQAAPLVVVPPNLNVYSVALQNALVPQSAWPTLVCSGANTAALQNASLSLDVSAANSLGPTLTLTNIAGGGANTAASVDFNTFPPSSAGTYNPTARIEALDVGNEANDIVFLSNNPGAANNVLGERLRITSQGHVGIGTPAPRSIIDADVSAPAGLGPVLTLTNTGGGQDGAAAAIDFNTFAPSSSGTYNPSARIEAVDDGHSGNAIVISTNNPGAPNSGLSERVHITSSGDTSINGNLTVGGTNNLSIGGQATVTNNLSVGGQATVSNLMVGNQATVTNNLSVEGQATVTNSLTVSKGPLTIGGVIPFNTDALTVNEQGSANFVALGRVTGSHGANSIRGSTDLWLECDPGSHIYLNGTVQGPPGSDFQLASDTGHHILLNGTVQGPAGSDFAERFPAKEAVDPGEVVIFDHALGGVVPCYRENDKRAVGIVSGAPAFTLGMEADEPAIALCGRLLCKVDADVAPIAPGDLLTTSTTRGHAQKADPGQAVGAIIGKALEPLCSGRGKILVLVTIQ